MKISRTERLANVSMKLFEALESFFIILLKLSQKLNYFSFQKFKTLKAESLNIQSRTAGLKFLINLQRLVPFHLPLGKSNFLQACRSSVDKAKQKLHKISTFDSSHISLNTKTSTRLMTQVSSRI